MSPREGEPDSRSRSLPQRSKNWLSYNVLGWMERICVSYPGGLALGTLSLTIAVTSDKSFPLSDSLSPRVKWG